jgi:hypothetical protein
MKKELSVFRNKIIITVFILLCTQAGLFAAEGESAVTRRFGIFIGSNNGGRDRAMLRYAVSDARSVSRVLPAWAESPARTISSSWSRPQAK